MDDAVNKSADGLTHERLKGWQAALSPTGFSGRARILVGAYREHAEPMHIASGRFGRGQVHFEAPPSCRVRAEMDRLTGSTRAPNRIPSCRRRSYEHEEAREAHLNRRRVWVCEFSK